MLAQGIVCSAGPRALLYVRSVECDQQDPDEAIPRLVYAMDGDTAWILARKYLPERGQSTQQSELSVQLRLPQTPYVTLKCLYSAF